MDRLDAEVLVALQDDFPTVEHPYRVIAERLGADERTVFARIRELVRCRLVRRLGPRYDSRKLGRAGTLAAARLRPERLEEVGKLLAGYRQVTHCYERTGSRFNLWFTVMADSTSAIDKLIRDLRTRVGAEELHSLPAESVYKLHVRFEPDPARHSSGPPRPSAEDASAEPDETDRRLISVTQAGLPIVLRPYAEVADRLGLSPEEVVERLSAMCASGLIRTMGAVLNGRGLGCLGNALVAWKIPAADCDRVGEIFAGVEEISHCYRRRALADFPYTIYTMVHGRDRADCERIVQRMAKHSGADDYVMLPTVREFRGEQADGA